ncbi:hypothetical protein ABID65_008205 [Bradyrhizobium sp. S3.9.2]|uniref:alpha-amylase family glycosyl hydrolase n=2 Tax=Nitrobacteraceae TaxID=41294 RepID=UPI00339B235C
MASGWYRVIESPRQPSPIHQRTDRDGRPTALEEAKSPQEDRHEIKAALAFRKGVCQAIRKARRASLPQLGRQHACRRQKEIRHQEASEESLIEKLGAAGQPRRHGAHITGHGVTFNLWAPSAGSVELLENGQAPRRMPRDAEGWYQAWSPTAHAGTRYQYRINDELVVPDPASFFQPDDVDKPSEVINISALRDGDPYLGRPWSEAVIYELHVGTFSDEGTYTGVEKRLDYLRDLGITAIELMPINDVPGRYNWGYDGVLLNAPNARYGRPEDLKRLLRAAHQRDMMVYLDVVYNHFGPQLNYLHSYAQNFFSDRHTTGWGPAVNLEGEHCAFVRQFLIDNALMWLRDYGFDGLRFDAVHALKDGSERHFLVELAESVREQVNGRQVHLMLENEANEAHLLERQDGRATLYDAQWGDDFHNALHVLLTGETRDITAPLPTNRFSIWLGHSRKGLRIRAKCFRCTTGREASRALICRPRRPSSSRRITIRWATGRSANDWQSLSAARSLSKPWPFCFSVRIFRCCLWARRPRPRRPSCSLPTGRARLPFSPAKAGARNSRISRHSRHQKCATGFRTHAAPKHSWRPNWTGRR